jgi:hypothetical protein
MPDEDNVIPIVDGDWFEDDIVERFRALASCQMKTSEPILSAADQING